MGPPVWGTAIPEVKGIVIEWMDERRTGTMTTMTK